MSTVYDVAIVGAGIVGLAHAWRAAERGLRVLLCERSHRAEGASIRNFGMIWPIGQPAGELLQLALSSRQLWLQLQQQGVLEVQECGSLHLAHHEDEWAVLKEFTQMGSHDTQLITSQETLRTAPLANPDGLIGAMWSASELRVNPRVASQQIATWLTQKMGVRVEFSTLVTQIEGQTLHASDGRIWNARRILICSGSDLLTLYPNVLACSELRLCKLQMLKSVPQPLGFRQQPHLASGLTLRHYTSFSVCPTITELRQRIAQTMPELDRYGIHVMASPFPNGEVILGDSHEYGDEISPFDKPEIDALMLREIRKVFRLGDWTIAERWHGLYAKHPTLPVFEADCSETVSVCVGPGGSGMTMSFGLAERACQRWWGSVK